MILYALICDQDHEFDSWFKSSAAYDMQAKRGLITCPYCASSKIQKALMAPAVATSRQKEQRTIIDAEPSVTPAPAAPKVTPPTAPSAVPQQNFALLDAQNEHMRTLIRALHDTLTKDASDVGTDFAQEARDMHDGLKEKRSIYGRVSLDEVQSLVDDGIPVLPLPDLPEGKN
jgi:hypothetical protein